MWPRNFCNRFNNLALNNIGAKAAVPKSPSNATSQVIKTDSVHLHGEIVGLVIDGLVHRVEHVRHLLADSVQFRIDLRMHDRYGGFVIAAKRRLANTSRQRHALIELASDVPDCRGPCGIVAYCLSGIGVKLVSDRIEIGVDLTLCRRVGLGNFPI